MAFRRKVLVIEDNFLNREMLTELLSEEYDVYQASNGEEGLSIAKSHADTLALILLDVMMPVMDGYTFLSKIKEDERLDMIPVIVMTQSGGTEEQIMALSHGATDFVPKPYNAQIILHRMANLIKLRETSAVVNQFKFDALTGLYSKEFFYTSVKERLQEDPDGEYCIVCSNIENFKLVNDIFGIREGDRLLQETAQLMQNMVGDEGFCGRLSADRFLCFQKKGMEQYDRQHFGKLDLSLSSLMKSIIMRWGIYEITDRSVSVEQMCDRAMLAADSIRGKYSRYFAVYDDKLRAALLREKMITDSMEKALAEKQFTVYLQPKYGLQKETIVGAEALVRWFHPEFGLISPGEFIPIFEKNGFIQKLDMYIWRMTCSLISKWKQEGLSVLPVSVNVSRADLFMDDPVSVFVNLVREFQIRPSDLHLEITESAYADNTEIIVSTVRQLREKGFIIELDDFGSGYSSLNTLSAMPVDILKLDLKFVHGEIEKPEENSILNDVITMAHRMHLRVVAEGVETANQAERLRMIGCDYVQGYYFSAPLPIRDYESLLLSQKEKADEQELDILPERKQVNTLLIIDENIDYRKKVVETFEDEYHVVQIDNTEEAIRYIESESRNGISAIILSLTLPEHGADRVMEVIRKGPSRWRIPVLGTIPGYAQAQNLTILSETDDFLCKKHPAFDLKRRIHHLVDILAFERKEMSLMNEANHDILTGLLNRRGLDSTLQDLQKIDMPAAACMFDMDDLKRINDSFGHEMGDRMLIEFSRIVNSVTRASDIHCRYGGDEFLLILTNVTCCQKAVERCSDICDRFRRRMDALDMPATVSCGIATFENVSEKMEAITCADQTLYKAKQTRKGTCCIYRDEEGETGCYPF